MYFTNNADVNIHVNMISLLIGCMLDLEELSWQELPKFCSIHVLINEIRVSVLAIWSLWDFIFEPRIRIVFVTIIKRLSFYEIWQWKFDWYLKCNSYLLFLLYSSIITQKLSFSGHGFKASELDERQSSSMELRLDWHWWHNRP